MASKRAEAKIYNKGESRLKSVPSHGTIFSALNVECGRCGKWDMSPSRDERLHDYAANLYRFGWKDREDYGWCCPDCVQELEDNPGIYKHDFGHPEPEE